MLLLLPLNESLSMSIVACLPLCPALSVCVPAGVGSGAISHLFLREIKQVLKRRVQTAPEGPAKCDAEAFRVISLLLGDLAHRVLTGAKSIVNQGETVGTAQLHKVLS